MRISALTCKSRFENENVIVDCCMWKNKKPEKKRPCFDSYRKTSRRTSPLLPANTDNAGLHKSTLTKRNRFPFVRFELDTRYSNERIVRPRPTSDCCLPKLQKKKTDIYSVRKRSAILSDGTQVYGYRMIF